MQRAGTSGGMKVWPVVVAAIRAVVEVRPVTVVDANVGMQPVSEPAQPARQVWSWRVQPPHTPPRYHHAYQPCGQADEQSSTTTHRLPDVAAGAAAAAIVQETKKKRRAVCSGPEAVTAGSL